MFTQATMVIAHFVFVCAATGLLFLAIKKTIGLRVTPEEELAGLDVEEHGSPGYGFDTLAGAGSAAAGIPTPPPPPPPTGRDRRTNTPSLVTTHTKPPPPAHAR